MQIKKKKRNAKEKQKAKLHARNKHHGRYHLQELANTSPELSEYIFVNQYEIETIDFANPEAVKSLNKALLKHFYGVSNWQIPDNYLCPPIPGRADYIHNVADLLAGSNHFQIPKGSQVKCLDIGVGANCVYPLIGNSEYGWSFVGSDIDNVALENATKIVDENEHLKTKIKFRHQPNNKNIFAGVFELTERFHATLCNPPFYASIDEAKNATLKKLNNLNEEQVTEVKQNFGGQNRELWTHGGEGKFLKDMIYQSKPYENSCLWFTTLVSNQANLKGAYHYLKEVEALDVKTLSMGQGNKISRVLAWTFQPQEKHEKWFDHIKK
jgi:23S rRNA (adenine1618-N6)-methyltransferase